MDDLTEQEKELIEAIRNYTDSLHNESKRLRRYARELFEEMLDNKIKYGNRYYRKNRDEKKGKQ